MAHGPALCNYSEELAPCKDNGPCVLAMRFLLTQFKIFLLNSSSNLLARLYFKWTEYTSPMPAQFI